MRITPALSLLLPLTILAAAGCGMTPGTLIADNRQDVIISPVALTGGIELNLRNSGFAPQATVADVAILEFEVSSSVLSGPRVQTFDKNTVPSDKRVKFTELPPGDYTVKSVAKDASGDTIGAKTATVTVEAGKTAVVQLSMKLAPTQVTNPNGNLYIDFEMEDGEVIYLPIAEPSPLPTPTPTASATPNPHAASLGLYNLSSQKLSTKKYQVKGTVYNSATVALNGEIKAEFKAAKGLFGKKVEVVETTIVPVALNGKSTYDFTITSTKDADDVTLSISVK